jgi:Ca-activated chloride channel homolog
LKRRSLHQATARVRLARLALLLPLALPPAVTRAQSAGPRQPDAGARVSLVFTAFGKDGQPVADLKPEDVRVNADAAPRRVLELKPRTGAPLYIAIAIDASASQERILPNTKAVAELFVGGVMKPGADKVAVASFTGDLKLEQELTGDVEKVREAIARVEFVPPSGYISGGVIVSGRGTLPPNNTGSTAIWDAVSHIAGEVLPPSLGEGRRALLLITDGEDTSSRVKPDKAIADALQSGLAVYAIGIGDNYFDGVDKPPLQKIAERTGGRAFFPRKVGELADIFRRIQEELLSQYVVTFDAPGDARPGQLHKVKVELTNPALRAQGVRLDYPEGFFVGPPTAAKP